MPAAASTSAAAGKKRRLPGIEVGAEAPRARLASSRAAAAFASALPSALMGGVGPAMLSNCMAPDVALAAVATGIAAGTVLGALSTKGSPARRRVGVVAAVLTGAALALTLFLPTARTALFSLCNAVLNRYDDIYSTYLGLFPNAGLMAQDPAFGACLGAVAGTVGWAVTRTKHGGITLLAMTLVGALSFRLGLGAGPVALALGLGAWIAHCRAAQLQGSLRSVRAVAGNVAVCAAAIAAVFGLAMAFYQPIPAVDAAHAGVVAAVKEARFGHDTLPEGDLALAGGMNDASEGTGLTVTPRSTVQADVLLRGFVGADFDGEGWEALGHDAYEGEWKGMMSWLNAQGLVPGEQRAAYDDAAAVAGASSQEETAGIDVDASRANRRYVYAPYSTRSLDGADVDRRIDGSRSAGLFGPSSYRVEMDDVATADVIPDTTWLAGSNDPYAQAEAVWSAFAKDNYLDISTEEEAAVEELLFNDETWDASADVSAVAVISRVRTMLDTLASYTEEPAAAPQDGSFAQWFLGQEREGNSAYFATAAVLAFRSQGIPARYVEGYRADAEALNAAAAAGESLELGAGDAHAWAEVYLGGTGWTPVEVTPGFYTQALAADDVIDVGEAWSSGKKDGVVEEGSVAGNVAEPEEPERTLSPLKVLHRFLVAGAGAAAIAALVVGVAIAQRAMRLAIRKKEIADDDQAVCVPALYRYLASVVEEAVPGFDRARPLERAAEVAAAFPGVAEDEYRRVIELHQAYAFGARRIKPNELRTLRRFTERLHALLPEPKNLADRVRRAVGAAL